ncbi:exosortase F system-associated membrane protein [Salegentibacter sediminis]|uniref:exosortase F system-associated membrane protein n=1 Tax=Salegentibacter sediminis TaxID=1930251 RepID=UPI0009BF39AD|nr:exosortase F system-associated protein [Salegentibacter sediminis]
MRPIYRILIIGVLVVLLALVRVFEEHLFYDPINEFYRSGLYMLDQLPQYKLPELLLNLSFRFWLNSIISLLILFTAFLDKNIVKFAAILFLAFFVVGVAAYAYLLLNLDRGHVMSLFYVRRFLIHPVFILILLPAFFYHQLQKRTKP